MSGMKKKRKKKVKYTKLNGFRGSKKDFIKKLKNPQYI